MEFDVFEYEVFVKRNIGSGIGFMVGVMGVEEVVVVGFEGKFVWGFFVVFFGFSN